MYNKFLINYLYRSPEKTVSKFGIQIRKIINPLIRFAMPFTTKTKLKVLRRADIPDNRPIIFAATHGFKEDIIDTLITVNRQAYILIGSLSQVFKSSEGIAAWLAGTILVDRSNKESRINSKAKMVRVLNLGGNIIIFPEGTWNKSPNLMSNGLFPGVYDIAKATGALVAPVATHREEKYVYAILDDVFDITQFDRQTGITILRDKFSTLRYEMMDKYSRAKRDEFPFADKADAYWKKYIDDLMAEVEFYDYEEELHTKFIDKNIIEYSQAFEHLNNIKPNLQTAFLFNKRLK